MDTLKTRDRVASLSPYLAPKTQHVVILPNGWEISEGLAHAFREQVLRRIPELNHDRKYTLKRICGDVFWFLLTDAEARKGGLYIAQLVATSQLPLEFATCPHAVPKRYRRK